VQVDARFETAKRLGNFVNHAVDELVKVKDRGDSLGGLLHALQIVYEIGGQSTNRDELVVRGT
jgi:hypothetical protein